MPSRRPEALIQQARERIARIREALCTVDYLCSRTLLRRLKLRGKPGCRCAQDPDARHGPYYERGHMQAGKLVHKVLSPKQAATLRLVIANYRKVRKLLRAGGLDRTAHRIRRPRHTVNPNRQIIIGQLRLRCAKNERVR